MHRFHVNVDGRARREDGIHARPDTNDGRAFEHYVEVRADLRLLKHILPIQVYYAFHGSREPPEFVRPELLQNGNATDDRLEMRDKIVDPFEL
jgi:hypothetical protein